MIKFAGMGMAMGNTGSLMRRLPTLRIMTKMGFAEAMKRIFNVP